MLRRAKNTLSWHVSKQLQQSAGLCSSQQDVVQEQKHKAPAGPLQGIKVPHMTWDQLQQSHLSCSIAVATTHQKSCR